MKRYTRFFAFVTVSDYVTSFGGEEVLGPSSLIKFAWHSQAKTAQVALTTSRAV